MNLSSQWSTDCLICPTKREVQQSFVERQPLRDLEVPKLFHNTVWSKWRRRQQVTGRLGTFKVRILVEATRSRAPTATATSTKTRKCLLQYARYESNQTKKSKQKDWIWSNRRTRRERQRNGALSHLTVLKQPHKLQIIRHHRIFKGLSIYQSTNDLNLVRRILTVHLENSMLRPKALMGSILLPPKCSGESQEPDAMKSMKVVIP